MDLEYELGTELRQFRSNGVLVIESSNVTGIKRMRFDSCALFLLADDVTVTEYIEDKVADAAWRAGSVGFIPRDLLIRTLPNGAYKEWLLLLEPGPLRDAVDGFLELQHIPMRYADITASDVVGMVQVLRDLVINGEADSWPLITDSLVMGIAAAVARELSEEGRREATARNAVGLGAMRAQRVIDYIDANIGKRLRLHELADVALLSTHHFARMFKAEFGVTPARFVLERRIRYARNLLRLPGWSIAEVAIAAGFASQSHMTTIFAEHVGATPAEYRRGGDGRARS